MGELLLLQRELAECESCFQQALRIARRQQAKSLELRWQRASRGFGANSVEPSDADDRFLANPTIRWCGQGISLEGRASWFHCCPANGWLRRHAAAWTERSRRLKVPLSRPCQIQQITPETGS
jgi:hypothetical protein